MAKLSPKIAMIGAAVTVAIAPILVISDSALAQSVTICQSLNFQLAKCSLDTRYGVILSRIYSNTTCRYGYTWGYGRGYVWVDRGCRARFEADNRYYYDEYEEYERCLRRRPCRR